MNDAPHEHPQEQQSQSTTSPFVEELTKLGRNFSQLIKDVLESPQLQEARKEVTVGAQSVIEEINEAMVKARESQVTKSVTQKAAQTAEDIKSSPVTENIKIGLLNALKSVNQELGDIVQRMEQQASQPQPSAASSAPEPQAAEAKVSEPGMPEAATSQPQTPAPEVSEPETPAAAAPEAPEPPQPPADPT